MNINPEQMARQQLAQGQPQPTFNQPGPNVTPNATMATSGVTPSIGPMNAQTKPVTPFSIGADPFERMQDLKDMSDNQIYVGMQQGVITPVEGLITMQTRNEARRRHREQELAKQAGKKSVVEQVTEEFVSNSGIASDPQMQEEKPVIAKKEGGVIGYYPGGLVETQMELARLKDQLEKQQNKTTLGGLFPLRSTSYRDNTAPIKKKIEELETRIEGFGKMPGMGDGVVAYPKKNFYQPDDSNVMGMTDQGEVVTFDEKTGRTMYTPFMASGVEGAKVEKSETPLMTGEETIGTPENPFGSNQELVNKYTNDARTIFQQKGADDRTTDTMLGILKRESGFDYDVLVGRKAGTSGELGGFQLNPNSFGKGKNPGFGARGDLSAAELSDFGVGANTALDYFTGMKEYFGENYGDLGVDPHEVAIAAYNTGPGNIEKILKNKDNVKALQEGTSFIDLLPESVQGYVKDVLQTETQEELESDVEKMREERKGTGTTFPEARVSTDVAELSGEPSSEMLSQFTGQRPTEENVELEDEQQVVAATSPDDIADINNPDDQDKVVQNIKRGIFGNNPNDSETLQNLLTKSTSVEDVKKLVSELYPGSAVKEVTKIVDEAMGDLFENKKDMENFYKGKQFISMAQAVMAPGQDLVQSLVNMVGVGAAEKEKLIKLRQSYSDKMVKLRTAKAQIMSADETTRGKIAGDLYSNLTKANSEATKSLVNYITEQAKLSQEYIKSKATLLADADIINMVKEDMEIFREAYKDANPSKDTDSPEFARSMIMMEKLLMNATADSFLKGAEFDPAPYFQQIFKDTAVADQVAFENKEARKKAFDKAMEFLGGGTKPLAATIGWLFKQPSPDDKEASAEYMDKFKKLFGGDFYIDPSDFSLKPKK